MNASIILQCDWCGIEFYVGSFLNPLHLEWWLMAHRQNKETSAYGGTFYQVRLFGVRLWAWPGAKP